MNLRLYCLQLCSRRVVICTVAQQLIVRLLLLRFGMVDHVKTVTEFSLQLICIFHDTKFAYRVSAVSVAQISSFVTLPLKHFVR